MKAFWTSHNEFIDLEEVVYFYEEVKKVDEPNKWCIGFKSGDSLTVKPESAEEIKKALKGAFPC